ncbi:MAG: ATP-binding protein [Stellaceae bacterium]
MMDDTSPRQDLSTASTGLSSAANAPGRIGMVTVVSGFKLSCMLFGAGAQTGVQPAYEHVQIGDLIKVPTAATIAFGFVDSLALKDPAGGTGRGIATAEVELLGEIATRTDGKPPSFTRGISVYPVLGAAVFQASPNDLDCIYRKPDSPSLPIGALHQDPSKTAYLISQEFLCKHSAILGTTGSGKSCSLTVVLRSLLSAHPNGHVVVLDPHGEYGHAFGSMAECINTHNIELPYWLMSAEEITEVLCSREPISRSREANILKEAIIAAKQSFLGESEGEVFLTVDTPTPYRMPAVVKHISDAMGKLDKPDSTLPYLRLMGTIEDLRQDLRYAFMFPGLTVRDNLTEILSRILRIPVSGKPITILDLSSVPSEIVNVVVSLLCRLIFDFAIWSLREKSVPILLVCDEAHRYVPNDASLGFEPTRRAIARIAKEGRKYGVSLCLVTQRPSEISEAILSQCSTVFAMRMTNDKDQNLVRRTLPETAAGLLNTLPTLRQQEAIAVGEGVPHPMRIRFNDLERALRPQGGSTNFPMAWETDNQGVEFLTETIDRWRWHAH